MFESLGDQLVDGQLMLTIAVAIAAAAAVLTFAMPLLESDTLGKRMKSVAFERDKIRQRERENIRSLAAIRQSAEKAKLKRRRHPYGGDHAATAERIRERFRAVRDPIARRGASRRRAPGHGACERYNHRARE